VNTARFTLRIRSERGFLRHKGGTSRASTSNAMTNAWTNREFMTSGLEEANDDSRKTLV
jgi:hypothetical protein